MRIRNIKNKEQILLNSNYVLKKYPQKGKWNTLFKNTNPICIEIGTGKCSFIYEMAKQNPNINYIGVEKIDTVLALGVKELEQKQKLKNLFLINYDASKIDEIFQNEIDRIYLNFSDPWPKARHEKRRLTSSNFLNMYTEICKAPVEIEFKTDNQGLFEYSLCSLNNNNWKFVDLTFDLHARNEEIIMTEYEKKFHSLGHPIYYVKTIYKGNL